MVRVCTGDERAFELLVERFWGRTLIYARHLCGDPDRAYDVTQEAFVRLWARREQWAGSGSVRIWLLRTSRNLVISDQRRWKVRAHRALEVAEEYRRVRTPLEDTEEMEIGMAIRTALRRLSPRRREAFTLFHLQGLSYREISGIMGVRSQTVANYIQAAVSDLRVLLAHHRQRNPPARQSADQNEPTVATDPELR
jgi:RNA polymerase sigma-70 factor (ECF subfamily)